MVIENKNNQDLEIYDFGVNLDPLEFISGLTIRVGDNGPGTVVTIYIVQLNFIRKVYEYIVKLRHKCFNFKLQFSLGVQIDEFQP